MGGYKYDFQYTYLTHEGFVFLSNSGNKISSRYLCLIFSEIRKAVDELPDWLTNHTLRRSWADNFIRTSRQIAKEEGHSIDYMDGSAINALRDQHGHKSQSTSTELYTKAINEENTNLAIQKNDKKRVSEYPLFAKLLKKYE